jgi:hypothetical protein
MHPSVADLPAAHAPTNSSRASYSKEYGFNAGPLAVDALVDHFKHPVELPVAVDGLDAAELAVVTFPAPRPAACARGCAADGQGWFDQQGKGRAESGYGPKAPARSPAVDRVLKGGVLEEVGSGSSSGSSSRSGS